MPRGVYPRDKTKKNKVEKNSKSKMPKTMKVTKSPALKVRTDISTEGRFRVLTENISTMVKVLSLDTDKKVFAEVVTELMQNFQALKSLRQEVFGNFLEKTVEEAKSNGGVPLPAKPVIPVPPIPSQS